MISTWISMTGRIAAIALLAAAAGAARAQDPWVVYEGGEGPGKGKHIVLVSGDEEYRSEEALPQLGRILAARHGFRCTVLFAYNEGGGYIDPTHQTNIPGLEALDSADLMVIFTRYRNLPDEQMRHIEKYLLAGKPLIGVRTSTHAFKTESGSPWEHYSDGYAGEKAEWAEGFGRLVLGEKWISHHGIHKHESTRGRLSPSVSDHPVLRGIRDGEIWGPTDVYGVRLPLPGDSLPLVLGEVVKRDGEYDEADLFFGMRPEDATPVKGRKNNPMMPVAWTRTYALPGGTPGKAFVTTLGSSSDLVNEPLRRLFVNAAYWALDLEEHLPESGAEAGIVGEFNPTKYEFRSPEDWRERNLQPASLAFDTASAAL